jgi:hypothetical protein
MPTLTANELNPRKINFSFDQTNVYIVASLRSICPYPLIAAGLSFKKSFILFYLTSKFSNMKNLFLFLFVTLLYAACTGTTSTSDSGTSTGSAIALPYTAAYSSSFSIGSDSTVANVLNNYKAWESNDMEAMKATFGDSVAASFSNGFKFKGSRDSAMKIAAMYRTVYLKLK